MNHYEVQRIAERVGFGSVSFQIRTALNTGNLIEVGYIYSKGEKILFCKRSKNEKFKLCNGFSSLEESGLP